MRKLQALLIALSAIALSAIACMNPVRGAEPLTGHQKDLVEDYLANILLRPETAVWRFDPLKPYLGDTKLVCGAVNFQSAMRKYLGFHRFYALLDHDRITLAQVEDKEEDPSGRLQDKLDQLCGTACDATTGGAAQGRCSARQTR